MLAVAYDEEVIYFYEISENRQLTKIGVCKQLPSTPIQLDFSNDGKLIQVCVFLRLVNSKNFFLNIQFSFLAKTVQR